MLLQSGSDPRMLDRVQHAADAAGARKRPAGSVSGRRGSALTRVYSASLEPPFPEVPDMIEIRRNDIEKSCAVCGRTLLLGERMVAYERPEGDDARVCELCLDQADALGWIREGSLSVPLQLQSARHAKRAACAGFLGGSQRRPGVPEPFTPEALPADPRDAVEAGLELFNESYHPRTVMGIARTLGDPRVSVVKRSHREVVVTVAWDLSWYQFRVDMLGPQPVTLQHRGEDVGEIDSRFRDWNAQAEPDGTLALAV